MGRQLDLYRRSAPISNNPLNTITAGNLAKLIAQPGPDTQKILADGLQEAITNILTWIDTGTGLDLVGWANSLESLLNEAGVEWTTLLGGLNTWLQSVGTDATNAWNNWVTALENTEQATIADLTAWWNQTQTDATNAWNNWVTILETLGQTTATDFADLVAAIESNASNAAQNWETVLEDVGIPAATATSFVSWLQTLLTPNSALNASNLWGLIPVEAVGQVASTAVVDASLNPLLNPNFESAISVSPGSGWVWDSLVYYTPPSGDTAPGSAKVTADGVLHALRSNLIPVAAGQSLAVSLPILVSGVTATGTPIALHVITFAGDTQTGITPVAAIAAPTGATTGWVNPPSGSKGGTLAGTYTVASGVTQVQFRLVVDTTATVGTVWFGNATASLSGGFLANLQADTNDVIDSLSPGGTAAEFVTGVQNLLGLFGLSKSSLGSATDLTAFWTAVVTDFLNPLNALEVEAANIIGDIEIAAINGLGLALSALLGTTTFQSLLDGIANVMGHSGTGHTITNIETYLGLIPPANVTNVLGGSNLGADVSAVSTTANNGTSWSTRLTNDLLILLDVFHLTYTSSQWNSAWADLLSLFGIVNSTTTPTNPAPTIGASITSAQASATTATTNAATAQTTANTGVTNASAAQGTANTAVTNAGTAQTTANTGNTNTGTFLSYTRILSDVFHLTYQAGSPSDTPTTLGTNGKPTWYSAWNGLLVLEGLVKSVTAPTDTAPTTGTVIQANTATATTAGTNASIAIASNQSVVDQFNYAMTGVATTGQPLTSIYGNATAIPASNIVGATGATVTYGAVGAGNTATPVSSPASISWSHTPAPTDLAVYAFVCYYVGSTSTFSTALTYSGAAMTKVKAITSSAVSGSTLTIECWRIGVTPTGSPASATIVATATQTAGSTSNCGMTGNSVSYFGAKTGVTSSSTGGVSGAMVMSTTSAADKRVIAAYATLAASGSWASFSQTQRSSQNPLNPTLFIGDALGAASVSFSVAHGSGGVWAGLEIEVSN